MILIPDIHIHTRYGEKILERLEEIFAKHNDREVLFLGDYVYMFSFDRVFLLRLFGLFVNLYKQGRKVIVMSGNHDWIQGHFVFEEGKQAFDTIVKIDNSESRGELFFATQPVHWIDNSDNLHIVLPFNDNLKEPLKSNVYDPTSRKESNQIELVQQIEALSLSSKSSEKLSALLNQIVLNYYETSKDRYNQIILYHHYYTADTQFPGVKAIFHFRDIALSPLLFKLTTLQLISGHIHEPFTYENYLCCGSFWHTSSLEKNECKYYFVGDVQGGFEANMIHINPKISIDVSIEEGKEMILLQDFVEQYLHSTISDSKNRLKNKLIARVKTESIDLSQLDLTIDVPSNPKSIIIAEDLRDQLHDYHVQTRMNKVNKEQFKNDVQSDYRYSFTDRKQLLEKYLQHKYPLQYTSLIDFLNKYKII